MIRGRIGAWLTATCILVPGLAAAQGLTGELIGTVKDQQGAVLRGALVRIASPSLIGGSATTSTDDRGQLRFPTLAPGSYVLDVELAGFSSYHEEDIRIGVSATLERTIVLNLAGVSDSVVVQGTSSRIEARSSGIETRFGSDYLRTIPSRRFSMFDAIRAAPGVSPTSPSSGTVNTVSAFGSGGNENLFLIDGTNFTCPCAGVSRAEPSVDIIQEVQVQSVGVSAEYGNIQGTIFNVVTRQGGSRLEYDAAYYGQPTSLTARPVRLNVPGGSATGYERERYRDFTTSLGGPIRRDRLWFFAAYQYLRDFDSQPGTDPEHPRAYEQNKGFAKLTWQFGHGIQLMQSFNSEFWVNPQAPTLVTPFEATLRPHATVPTTTFGHFTQTLSPSTGWDVRVGRFVYTRRDDPATGDAATANHFDRVTGVSSGNAPQIGGLLLVRTTAKATLTHYQHGPFADHQWKGGAQFEQGRHEQPQVIPGGVRFVDNNGQPFQTISSPPSNSGGEFDTFAAFATDAMTISRVTINAGVRFDHSRAISQNVPAVDAAGHNTTQTISGAGTLYTWNVVSPRLGVTAKLTADGRTILRSSYGRFNQGVLTGEIGPIHPGVQPITTMQFDPATGGYTTLVSVVDPRVNLALDPHTRAPRTDEYSVGVDREIGRALAVGLAYIHKTGTDYIAWTDVAGKYVQKTVTLPDGRPLPVFELQGPASSRRFLLTNPDGYSMTYNGMVIAVEKRPAHGWMAQGSYTYSRTYGLQASSGGGAADPQVSTVAPAFPTTTFGRDPNNLTNAYGRLPNDRPHMLRAAGSMDVRRIGVTFAASFQAVSGKPWAATTQVSLAQGDQRILLEPRGERRLSAQSLLDVRVAKAIRIPRVGHTELLFDVLNVLNDTAAENLASDNLFSRNFGLPTVFVDPRRLMIGLRVALLQ
jgi:hypothetical protein